MILEHGIKVLEKVFGKKLCQIVTVNGMQVGIMSEKERIDLVFVL